MPRRRLLTPAERAGLLAFPTTDDDLIRHYTFAEPDLSAIRQRRGAHNRLGFAVQLCYLRYPGLALPPDAQPPTPLLVLVGRRLGIDPDLWAQYAQRSETRREHLAALQAWLGLSLFTMADYRRLVDHLAELARQTDRGRAGRGTGRAVATRPHYPASGRCHRADVQRGARPGHAPCVRGTDRLFVRSPPTRPRRPSGTARGHQGQRAGLVAPTPWSAQGQAHPGPFGSAQGGSRPVAARWAGTGRPPEPPAEACPRGRPDDRPTLARPGTGPVVTPPWSRCSSTHGQR
jgi:hypothetical protein